MLLGGRSHARDILPMYKWSGELADGYILKRIVHFYISGGYISVLYQWGILKLFLKWRALCCCPFVQYNICWMSYELVWNRKELPSRVRGEWVEVWWFWDQYQLEDTDEHVLNLLEVSKFFTWWWISTSCEEVKRVGHLYCKCITTPVRAAG